jgi:hypothetical protein
MQFDKIIMNPPYDGNLHLKILEQAISLLKDDGVCINLSPIRWLQDPLAEYKKNSDWYKFKAVRERIQGLIPISAKVCTELFGGEQEGAAFSEEIGIYYIKKNVSTWKPVGNSILDKVFDKAKVDTPGHRIPYSTYANRSTENFIVLKKIHDSTRRGSIRDLVIRSSKYGVFVNGKCNGMSLLETKDSIKNSVHGDVNNFPVICTKTPTEAVKVYNSFKTTFYRYVCSKASVDQNVPLNYLPWMGNSINPRTGLKGYESEWTDKDFYEYFDITEQEQKEIEETMKPYM